MKKLIALFTSFVLCLALFAGCGSSDETLSGTAAAGTDTSTLYLTVENNTYIFSLSGSSVTGTLEEGAEISLTYNGKVDLSSEVQTVKVKDVKVTKPAPAPTSEPATTTAPSTSEAPAGDQTLSGTISDISSMNVLAVMSADQKLYLFNPDGAEVTGGGIVAGNNVTVTYQGALTDSGTDMQTVTVSKIETGGDAPTDTVQKPAAAPAASSKTQFISGRIGEDSSMNNLQLQGYDGNTYSFSTEDVEVSGIGIVVGNNCTVGYKGMLDPSNTGVQDVTVVRVATSEFQTAQQAAAAKQQTRPDNVMTGVVSADSSMNYLVINGDDGNQYGLPMDGISLTGTVVEGNRATVHFTGTLTDGDSSNVTYIVIG